MDFSLGEALETGSSATLVPGAEPELAFMIYIILFASFFVILSAFGFFHILGLILVSFLDFLLDLSWSVRVKLRRAHL